MIAYLEGKIINKTSQYLVVFINGVGYKVFVDSSILSNHDIGQEIKLSIYHRIKEDDSALYGFIKPEELELFELLISVSGIGPKSGLNVLSASSIDDIKQSISMNDHSLLVKVSGIGKKTAERIVLELKNKIGVLPGSMADGSSLAVASEEIDALMQLGYGLSQARDALQRVDPGIVDISERVKQALKLI